MRARPLWGPIDTPDGIFVPGPHGTSSEALVYPGNSSAIALLESGGEALLVDSGFRSGAEYPPGVLDTITKTIDDLGVDLQYILQTHWHFDHTGNTAYLRDRYGAEVLCHSDEREILEDPLLATRPEYLESFGGDPVEIARDFNLSDPSTLTMSEEAMREHWNFPVTVDRTVADGEILAVGEREFEVVHTPGHTPGHLSLYAPETNSLYLADVMYWPTPQYPYPIGKVDDQIQSVRRCLDLDASYLYPGHELPRCGREDVQDYLLDVLLKHRQLEDRILTVLSRHGPLTIPELHAETFVLTDRYTYADDGWHGNTLNCLHAHIRRHQTGGDVTRIERDDGSTAWDVTDAAARSDGQTSIHGGYERTLTLADVRSKFLE